MSQSQLAAVLGRVPSGLFILTTAYKGTETGMLSSWVMQAGFEPPTVSVALQKDRLVARWLSAGAAFVLNVLREDQKSLLSHFGRGFSEGENAFKGLDLNRTKSGLPLLPDSLGHLECHPQSHVDSGDHRVFLATILSGHMAADRQPYVHIRKNGLRY